jgi:hypothetical protein
MKMTAFWDTAPHRLAETNQRSRDAYCYHHKGDDGSSRHLIAQMMAAVNTSVTFVKTVPWLRHLHAGL